MLRYVSRFQGLILLMLGYVILLPAKLSAGAKPKQEILVAAAASLKDVFEEIGPAFEKQFPDIRVTFQFAASGALQQQIEQGAPVDVFVSAAQKQVDALLQKDLLVKGSVETLFSNVLVLIVPNNKAGPQSLDELKKADYKRIALGEKRTVPAGQYAEAWLENSGLLETLRNRLVPAANVRQILTFVESGNVSAGFVYASDALASTRVKVALRAEPGKHPPIVYPLALVKKSNQQEAGRAFAKFLQSAPAQTILIKHGFILPTEKAS